MRGVKEPKKTKLDRVIDAVAPTWGLRRQEARLRMAVATNAFRGAGKGKSLQQWTTVSGTQDEDYGGDLQELRVRSRDLECNNPIAKSAIDGAKRYVVGSGPVLNAQIDRDFLGLGDEEADTLEEQIQREWKLYSESREFDYARILSFPEGCRQLFVNCLLSGDVFDNLVYWRRGGSPYSVKHQFIEADLISNPGNISDGTVPKKADYKGARGPVYGGVEKDPETHEPIAYYCCNRAAKRGKKTWERLPAFAEDGRPLIIHVFDQKRPGGSRGVPYLAPVIEPLKQIGRYTEAELMGAVVAGMFTVFVHSKNGKRLTPIATAEQDDDTDTDVQLGYGAVVGGLDVDDKVDTANPGRPNAQFDPFFIAICKQIGAALGQPVEILLKAFNSSYSAARAAMLDAWRFFSDCRAFIEREWLEDIYAAFFEEAVILDRIRAPGFLAAGYGSAIRKAWLGKVWTWPGKGHIRPDQEMKGAAQRIEWGLSTRTQETAELTGGNYKANAKQRRGEAREEMAIADISNETEQQQEPTQ